ncbi:MAG: Ig-like domain-containing protein, partial [Chthoniobacteraceae bacterium]
ASAGSPGATATNLSGWDFNAISPSSAQTNVDVWDGAVSSGNGVAISRSDYSGADFSVIKVAANDLSTFDLRSVGLNVQIVQGSTVVAGHSVTLTGLNSAGSAVAGATLTAAVNDALLVSFDVSANPNFNGVSAFSIVPVTAGDSIGYVFIDNINAINFAALDNVAPAPPSMPDLAIGSDSGASSSDNLTNVNRPILTGTAEAGTTVKLYDTDGLTLLGSGTATGGNWSITTSSLAQGNHTITAKAIDAAGNISAASVGLTITIDSVSPNPNSVVLPANASYGEGDHLDFTVNYSKSITVTTFGGTPYIAIGLDTGGAVRASFLFGSGTSSLTFRYTVANGNFDANGITVSPTVTLNGGTLRDTAGNDAVLPLTGIGSTTGIRVDATPPTVSSINRVQATPTNLASLSYTVTFSKAVTGVDVSDFALTTTGTVSALNLNVAPVTSSTYTITISTISGAGTLRLDLKSSGTGIADLAGNAIASGYTAGQPYSVDRVAPVVASVGVPVNGTYLATQNLAFTVTFSEAVTVTTTGGVPRLPITLDTGGTVNAAYLSGSGSSTLTFRYTVVSGNADIDGVSIASALQTNGGTIRDASGNDATLALNNVPSTAGVLVDAILPVVSSVNLPANGTYTAGQTLDFVVNYSEAVTVNTTGGVPYLGVTLDTGGSVRATYLAGSGGTALAFRYTVVTGNADANGIVLVSSITTNSATLRDASGNNAVLTMSGVGATTGILVDAVAPTVTSINRQTPSAATTNVDTVTFRVTFSEVVTGVDTTDFALTTTNVVTGAISSINAVSGSIYDVTVSSITGTGTLRLDLKSSGTGVSDLAGNAIAAGALGAQIYTIDTIAPTIASVTAPASGTYKVGDNLDFSVTFSEVVTATGAIRLPITLDTGGAVNASYLSGTGTNKLVFRYTVAAGTLDADGIAVASALLLNGGAISDLAGNGAVLTLNNVGDTTAVLVDGIAPTVLSVSAPAGGTYKLGAQLDFTVNFSENVTVTGTPRLAVTLDTGGTVNAPYLSGSGTSTLVFRYTVASGNADKTGIVLGAAIVPNGGALRDAAGNNAVAALNNVGATDTVLVDGIVPTVVSIVRMGSATTTATSLAYTVTFNESVTGVSPAAFVLITAGTVGATIASVTATNESTYIVTLNPVSGDGTLRLDLAASGTGIADLAGNAVASGFTTGEVYSLDHTAPAVTSVTVPANAIYASGQKLDFTVRLSEAAIVSTTGGTPFLPVMLDTGGTVNATYVSGSGTTALLFRYTVVAGNVDADGIALGASIAANGGTLRDAAGIDLNPLLNGVPSTAGVLVDAVAPTVLSVTAPAGGTYIPGAVLNFTVTFSEPITVATGGGTPALAITLDTGGPAQAAYVAGSGSATLTFRYTVATGQRDADGIAVSSSIVPRGSTLRDAAGNDASLTTPAFDTSAVLVDGLLPTVFSIARLLPTHATTSQASVTYRVTFNKNVTGVDVNDFILTTTGTADGTLGTLTAVSGKTYDLAVEALVFGGTIRLDLAANSGVTDAAGNVLTSAFTGGEIYTLVDNQAPSFTPGSDLTREQDAGAQTIAQWATDIDPGAPGESGQTLGFTVTADQPALFSVAPAIALDGTLTFTPKPAAFGTATVTVILHDDSDANNESAAATFAITLTSYDGQLGTYNGLVQAAPATDEGNDKTGVLRVAIGKAGAFTGALKLAGTSFALRGSFSKSGVASFGKPPASSVDLKRKNLPALVLTMQLDVSGGSDTLTATLTEDGAPFATIVADRALYVAAKNPVAPFLNVPTDLLGRYTVVFAAKTPAEQNRLPGEYPQGDGVGFLFVKSTGVAT